MTIQKKIKIASILFVLISMVCLAQTGNTPLPPPPMATPPPGYAPIDGGVLIGAFVALCYGVKRIIKNN